MSLNPYQQYRATKVETAGSVDLVVMLYQGAVRFIHLGIEAIEHEDARAAHTNLVRAQDIIVELRGSLNREEGGQIADRQRQAQSQGQAAEIGRPAISRAV